MLFRSNRRSIAGERARACATRPDDEQRVRRCAQQGGKKSRCCGIVSARSNVPRALERRAVMRRRCVDRPRHCPRPSCSPWPSVAPASSPSRPLPQASSSRASSPRPFPSALPLHDRRALHRGRPLLQGRPFRSAQVPNLPLDPSKRAASGGALEHRVQPRSCRRHRGSRRPCAIALLRRRSVTAPSRALGATRATMPLSRHRCDHRPCTRVHRRERPHRDRPGEGFRSPRQRTRHLAGLIRCRHDRVGRDHRVGGDGGEPRRRHRRSPRSRDLHSVPRRDRRCSDRRG